MKRLFTTMSLALALGAFGLAQPAHAADDRPTEACCCVVQDGNLVCTISGEVLEECCCE